MTTLTLYYDDIAIEVEVYESGRYRAATQEEPGEYSDVEIDSISYEIPQGDLTDEEYELYKEEVKDYVESSYFYDKACDALEEENESDFDDSPRYYDDY